MKKWVFGIIANVFVLSVCAQAPPWPFAQPNEDELSIILLGDNNFQHRENPEEALKYLIPTLRRADFNFFNLEGPFVGGTDDTTETDIPHKNWRYSNPDQVAAITAAPIDAVGVANNVTYPWSALMKSLHVLDSVRVKYAGGGKNLEAAHRPVIIEKKGLKVGFMQYAATVFPYNHAATESQPGIAQIKVHTAYQPPPNLDKPGQPPVVITWLDENSKQRMIRDIQSLDKRADIVIVSFHWGVSGTTQPVSYQTDIARSVIEAGADVVFGHGPHCYQKIEVYNGKPVFYSLGQAAFDDRRSDRWRRFREGLLVRLSVKDKEIQSVDIVPIWRDDDNFVRLYNPNTGQGHELYGILKSVNDKGASLELTEHAIQIQRFN